jgi:DNA replication protein DnaC
MIITHREDAQDLMTRCSCQKVDKAEKILKLSGINIEQARQTFSTFEVWNQGSKLAKEMASKYYKEFNNVRTTRRNSIALIGQVGSGKTHLCIALAMNFIKKGIEVVYMPYRDTLTLFKQNMIDEEYYNKKIRKYQLCEVLLIDDLFKGAMKNGKVNESDINIMFEIINYRYLNYLPLIVSSEYTADRLMDFDEAVGSRIIEMCKDYTAEIEENIKNNYRLR